MFATFAAIFEALDAIEEELAEVVTPEKRELLVQTLLSLRKTMDQCVQYWLKFEERVNEIEDRFELALPDTLPPGFLEELDGGGGSFELQSAAPAPKVGSVSTPVEEHEPPISEITAKAFRRGLGFWELAMLKEAVDEFKKVVEDDPDLVVGHICLGLSSAQLGKVEEAFRELKLVLALDQNKFIRALALNTLGIILTQKEDYRQAEHYFKRATEEDPELEEAWFNLGATFYNLRRYREAAEAFEKAGGLAGEDWEIDLYLGRAQSYLGQHQEAVKSLQRAFRINPKEPLIAFELGCIYRLMGQDDRAQCYFYTTRKLMELK
ncbi:MAG: tetratricopeptide repeat protein [Dethiobacteria bacterium]|jgi:tetratricopeptide (TPR) repeat protein|nr:tetratricopeptide repeat protein [Bacillota bacterium]NMD32508.1 tetratricopeptide repeat protein [Bacillota bacterium]HOB29576.1 tetratricopeptide repeat protein [Bacillota bacterium]HPZ42170.1 tetratricopeptide repeat protein [Bacillota bacterium]HQD53008.1 tetratricopeptide repeat protein [Bacillota bacterium]